jgi:thioester reductase-like protein
MQGYLLLTGATGLLGRYLLRDLTLADIPLAVVVRPTRWESATQRIETAMAHWERELGRALVRPVVLEGDIAESALGLSPADLDWVAANCRSVMHSAASLTFHAEEETGEPWRSNIQGTRNVLELCRQASIRHYHHVSTAYVCGRRRERILESELDVGQQPGNDYESSKLTAEKEVLASPIFDEVTVYRPSIIVGDSQTGFTTTYHGFYTPLRLSYALKQTMPAEAASRIDWLGQLQLSGMERKNLVPVEWVSAAMTQILARPELHGETYHLTNPNPATVGMMYEAMGRALAEHEVSAAPNRPAAPNRAATPSDETMGSFGEQMKIYQSYWSDDPQFDSTNTETALPQLPCPPVDVETMLRLIRFALKSNFGWPREAPATAAFELGRDLSRWLQADRPQPGSAAALRYVSLKISGSGGGQWHLVVDRDRLIGAGRGLISGDGPTCYLTSATFAGLSRGKLSLEDSINAGRLVVAGNSVRPVELARLFRDLAVPMTK